MTQKKPLYLLAGGRGSARKSPDPLIQAVFKETGVAAPLVAYVGVASDDDKSFFSRFEGMFREAGAGKVSHAVITPARAGLSRAKDILESADIVFISGGDVERGMQVLNEKNMTVFLRALYEGGKPFFGLSAGSIMLAREWVRWRDPDDDSTAELFPCLGFAPLICDTHDEADGWGELQAALSLKRGDATGYGIASGTALRVSPDGDVSALAGAVFRFGRQGGKVVRLPDLRPENPSP